MTTAGVQVVGSESSQTSPEPTAYRREETRTASFQQSLQAAQENLVTRQAATGAATAGVASQRAAAAKPAISSLTTTNYTANLRPMAVIRSSTSFRSTAAARTPNSSSERSHQAPSASTNLARLRQQNMIAGQRTVTPTTAANRSPIIGGVTRTGQTPAATKTSPTTAIPRDQGTAMALADYPRPVNDNGRGMHWIPTLQSDKGTIDRFVKEMVDMKIKWAVILNNDCNTTTNDYLVQQLVANEIEPIMRVYTPDGAPIQGDLKALVQHYKPMGVDYYQLYNEPNLDAENQWTKPDPVRYVDMWLPAAKAVTEAGGLPGFGSLAPGGNFDDIEFLKQSIDAVKAKGETKIFDRAWIGLHNYTLNHPLDYTKDSNGFLKFRWYDQIVREKLGRSLPIIGTEGGTHVGVNCDATMPAITEEKQVEMVTGAFEYMEKAEPYFFTTTYWIIANSVGGGRDAGFEKHALFQPGRTSPVVDALKQMPLSPRAIEQKPAATSAKTPAVTPEAQRFVDEAMKYLGKRYVWGGESPEEGFDCTGFTWYCMQQLGRQFPLHDLEGQMSAGKKVTRAELKPGDLVFFQNTYRQGLSHVGIYIGNDRFVHAASEKLGVITSSLDEQYWGSRYYGASRPFA